MGMRVEGFIFTKQSKDRLIGNLSLLFEQRKLILPRPDLWPAGIDELESYQYSVSEHDNLRTGAPSGMHDDIVIALALAAWQVPKQTGGPFIKSFPNADAAAAFSIRLSRLRNGFSA